MIDSRDARTSEVISAVALETTPEGVDLACRGAQGAFTELQALGRPGRAEMLRAMASALEERSQDVVAIAERESALGPGRLNGELKRACFQLRFFADVLAEGSYLEASIDHAGATPMGPRPDLRRILQPLGPIAVFGASNFPLAFSVPGGDTASALAAGCPVVAKVHDAHPATSILCAELLAEGGQKAGVGGQAVGLVFGEQSSAALVSHPLVQAVGFTGSLAGGRYLYGVAAGRPSPVPFYGELGALNTVVIGRGAATGPRASSIATGLAESFTLGVGQFCTKPGLVLVPSGVDNFVEALMAAVRGTSGAPMLSERIARGFQQGSADLRRATGTRVLAEGQADTSGAAYTGVPLLLEANGSDLDGALKAECFGPVLVVVRYRDEAHLAQVVGGLSPALTATVHADAADEEALHPVVDRLVATVGRLVWNGFPTGVAVSWAMHHGGPFPATTDPLHTSVGATAIRRWLKPVTYQGAPEGLLPPELRDVVEEGAAVPRRVDGRLELPAGYSGPASGR